MGGLPSGLGRTVGSLLVFQGPRMKGLDRGGFCTVAQWDNESGHGGTFVTAWPGS